jgi:hypothetical protein
MCDYSLTGVASRPAEAADTLVSTEFCRSSTRGFASVEDRSVAVSLLPGTEIAFEEDVAVDKSFISRTLIPEKLARFRKVNIDQPHQHHDALEFADGTVVLLNDLIPGQRATVLQLPADLEERGRPHEEIADPRSADTDLALT